MSGSRRLNGHNRALSAVLRPNEPMVPKRAYDRVLDDLIEAKSAIRRLRKSKHELEENIAIERQCWEMERIRFGSIAGCAGGQVGRSTDPGSELR